MILMVPFQLEIFYDCMKHLACAVFHWLWGWEMHPIISVPVWLICILLWGFWKYPSLTPHCCWPQNRVKMHLFLVFGCARLHRSWKVWHTLDFKSCESGDGLEEWEFHAASSRPPMVEIGKLPSSSGMAVQGAGWAAAAQLCCLQRDRFTCLTVIIPWWKKYSAFPLGALLSCSFLCYFSKEMKASSLIAWE